MLKFDQILVLIVVIVCLDLGKCRNLRPYFNPDSPDGLGKADEVQYITVGSSGEADDANSSEDYMESNPQNPYIFTIPSGKQPEKTEKPSKPNTETMNSKIPTTNITISEFTDLLMSLHSAMNSNATTETTATPAPTIIPVIPILPKPQQMPMPMPMPSIQQFGQYPRPSTMGVGGSPMFSSYGPMRGPAPGLMAVRPMPQSLGYPFGGMSGAVAGGSNALQPVFLLRSPTSSIGYPTGATNGCQFIRAG